MLGQIKWWLLVIIESQNTNKEKCIAGASHAIKPHPCAPEGLVPAAAAAASAIVSSIYKGSLEPKDGEYFSRSELPARFRYTPPSELEMEDIISGGAEVVF